MTLIDQVIQDMKDDIAVDDWTAIAELLEHCPEEYLKGYLREEEKPLTPLDTLKQNIKSYFAKNPDKYVWNTSSCGDHSNWDKTYHAALLQLRRDGMEGYTIRAELSFGVHEWTVTRDM